MSTGPLNAPVLLGSPITTARLWVTGLTPNPRGGWNYIAQTWELHDTNPVEWTVVTDLTTSPKSVKYFTPSGNYGNITISYPNNQLRAANGRIFWAGFDNLLFYYEPSTEDIHTLGPVVEVPPINPSQSTIPFRGVFGPDGNLYFTTQESARRPPLVFKVDPVTLTITNLGYVGTSLNAFTTYGYYIQADTATAAQYCYIAVGQDPWQLWALNINTGATTKLYEVTATGNISFFLRPEGIVASINTDVGFPDNVQTQLWCVDGTTYTYTPGYNPATLPFTPRSVTPASNPLVSPPGIDDSLGPEIVKWQPNGGGNWTDVFYPLTYTQPVPIESLGHRGDYVFGQVEQYNGAFAVLAHAPTNMLIQRPGLVSQAVYANDSPDGRLWFAGYPNGTVYALDVGGPWDDQNVHPQLIGSGNASSDIKYARFLAYAWGYFYMWGNRERSGTGGAINRIDPVSHAFLGANANLSNLYPSGMLIRADEKQVVCSTSTLNNVPPAQLVVYDLNLVELNRYTPNAAWTDTGKIYSARYDAAVVGVISTGTVYRYDLQTSQLLQSTSLGGTIGASTQDRDGTIWLMLGNNLVAMNPYDLSTTVVRDLTAIGPVTLMKWVDERLYVACSDKLWVLSPP